MYFLLLLCVSVVGCDRQQSTAEPVDFEVRFDRAIARIETATDTFVLNVEIAEDDSQRSLGLMRRTSLPEDAGMIFLFSEEQPPEKPFWMYNTLIPLSIAFLDAEGRIRNIRTMDPCPSPYPQYCTNYAAEVPYWSALEVNLGYFEERGIGIGDRVVLERD